MGVVIGWLAILTGGLVVTLKLTFFAAIFTIVWSTLLAIGNISPLRPVRWLASLYCDLFRSIPLLALIIFMYYGLGGVTAGLGISDFWLMVAALTLSEMLWGGRRGWQLRRLHQSMECRDSPTERFEQVPRCPGPK